mmetsp:Transcript_28718/g.37675  ORF Transcript_28718/g.37675 Transcript_28718/m.37675 type:complete len:208 (+) Transcript_28718:138-761(+)|eukprot:CAMPEP_0117759826 /NCGR_PEP_ID=MMETSP0947-20121206/16238_1 /TAXON_ID=44440 /ORGANISM="Chattonella subsalsa, Strain CCMP2191" /LENGTH=207 /DNA_ID=CAMNT_0005580345 /DNA_START=104 /DNA_END=727 /DNA_ORIENTATION=-
MTILLFILFSCLCIFGTLVRSSDIDKPNYWETAEAARWIVHNSTWGVLSTTSTQFDGTAFGNPQSISDGTVKGGSFGDVSSGIPYFYVSGMDASMQDIAVNPACSLSLSEAMLDCTVRDLDPEDPRCARLTLIGHMEELMEGDELSFAMDALFQRHPQMEDWPTDHGWKVTKLNIENIWMVNFFGGAIDVNVEDYFAANNFELVVEE